MCRARSMNFSMYSVPSPKAAGALRGGNQDLGRQVAVGRARRSDADRARRDLRCKAVPVGLRYADDRLEPELLAGADHPDGDFAAIRHEDATEGSAGQRSSAL